MTLPPSASDPRHGTHAGYYCIPCREQCCRGAVNEYERRRVELRRLGRPYTMPAVGVVRRVRALHAMGWPSSDIAAAAGISSGAALNKIIQTCSSVRVATHEKVSKAYDQLSMRHGPSDLVRQLAARKGWPPPLAWDDELLDDPNAQPEFGPKVLRRDRAVDQVIVERALAGIPVDGSTRVDRLEVRRRWIAAGRSVAELDRIQGWNVNRDLRIANAEQQRQVSEVAA